MTETKNFLFLKDQSGGYSKIQLDEILFVKSLGNYLQFYTESAHITTHGSMQSLSDYLGNDPRFMRVHRSFLVNLENVTHFSADGLKLRDHQIPVSNKSFEAIKTGFIVNHLFKNGA